MRVTTGAIIRPSSSDRAFPSAISAPTCRHSPTSIAEESLAPYLSPMRFGFRATFVVSLSLLAVIACVGGENQCLNPHPDLPSCRGVKGSGAPGGSSGGSSSVPTGSGDDGNDDPVPPSPAAAGSSGSVPGLDIGMDASAPAQAGGSSGELAGAGGESGSESQAGAGAGGAAGSEDAP
jgi:hypothetical protein